MHVVVDKVIFMDDKIKHSDIIVNDKLKMEGATEEEKLYLGWILNC